ncbi:MAG: DUF1016 N-terminal domain-containing protein [Lentimicrobium sp.]
MGNQLFGYGGEGCEVEGWGDVGQVTPHPLLGEGFTKGWSDKHVRHCLRFAETSPDREIVFALSRELSWTHFRILIYIGKELSKIFYHEMYRLVGWNTRASSDKIDSFKKEFYYRFLLPLLSIIVL